MFKVGEYVVYNNEVCKLVSRISEFYVLVPLTDDSLTIKVSNPNNIRKIISKKDMNKIISDIPNIPIIDVNNKELESFYKKLINTGSHEDLISIIKTAYLENKNRKLNNKKLIDRDTTYLTKAEKRLYNEFSIVLNKSYDDTKKYVEDKVSELVK